MARTQSMWNAQLWSVGIWLDNCGDAYKITTKFTVTIPEREAGRIMAVSMTPEEARSFAHSLLENADRAQEENLRKEK